jgi:hypothetical protein
MEIIYSNLLSKLIPLMLSTMKDLGRISPVPFSEVDSLPSKCINYKLIRHSYIHTTQNELLDLFDEFSICFLDKPGLLTNVRGILNLPDFVPKRLKPYKLLEMLKSEVEKKSTHHSVMSFIVPLYSSTISPIVCVVKQGTVKTSSMQVHSVSNLRYLNKLSHSMIHILYQN